MDATDARTCDLCGYSTSKASRFKRHKIIHSGEKPYKCGSCDYSCTRNDNLKTHSYTHTGEKPYQCSSCDFSCTSAGDLKKHSYTHTELQAITMNMDPVQENQVEEGELLKCSACGKKVETTLQEHTDTCDKYIEKYLGVKYKDEKQGKLTCEICGKQYKYWQDMKGHMDMHQGAMYLCDKCDKSFTFKKHLVKHKKSHNTVKDYACTICSWATNDKRNYKKHILSKHESIWTFKCDDCEFTGPTSKSLNAHTFCVHERGEPKCHLCNYVAKYKIKGKFQSNLDEKLKMHMKQKHQPNVKKESIKIKCDVCDYWALKYEVKHHKRKHHGSLKLICEKCGYNIRKEKNVFTIEKHNLYIHEGKTPQCSQCDFVTKHEADKHSRSGFILDVILRKHVENRHGEDVGEGKARYTEAADPKALKNQIKSMMDKSERRIPGKNNGFLHVCIVCGKEGYNTNIELHIETQHITGSTKACTICGKAFKNRQKLAYHMNKWHNS